MAKATGETGVARRWWWAVACPGCVNRTDKDDDMRVRVDKEQHRRMQTEAAHGARPGSVLPVGGSLSVLHVPHPIRNESSRIDYSPHTHSAPAGVQ